MGKYEIYKFLQEHPFDWFTIRELAKELEVGNRAIRRCVISLEAEKEIKGRCRGTYNNWNREFKIKDKVLK